MDMNIVNVRSVCRYDNALATFEAHFMRKLSNTGTELKKTLLIKKDMYLQS